MTADSRSCLDPPYCGSENDYGEELFSRDEFVELAKVLRGLKGHFIMSINDVPEVRDIFIPGARWTRQEVGLTYTVGGGANPLPAKELIYVG